MLFSRKAGTSFLMAALASLALSSCGLELGEKSVDQSLNLGGKDLGCLDGGTQTMVEYFHGHASSQQIGDLVDCMGRSLQLFADRTRGEAEGLYSDQELKNFIERYFLKDTRLPDGLVRELMEFKRTMLGGRSDRLTAGEIREARRFLEVIKEQAIRLQPFMPLTPEHYGSLSETEVDQGLSALESAASEIGKRMRGAGQDYEFTRLESLLTEVERTALTPSAAEAIAEFRASIPMFQRLKAFLLSPDHSRILSDEWEPLLTTSSRGFGLYLRFASIDQRYRSLVLANDGLAPGRAELLRIGRDISELLITAIGRRTEGVIRFEEFDSFVDSIDPKYLVVMGHTLQPEHLKNGLRAAVRRGLGGAEPGAIGRGAVGLTQAAVNRAWRLIQDWAEAQRYLDLAFTQLGKRAAGMRIAAESRPARRSQLLALTLEDVYGADQAGLSAPVLAAVDRMRGVIAEQPSLYRRGGTEVYFDSRNVGEDPLFSYAGLSQMNSMNLLSRLLMSAYAEEPARSKTAVVQSEVERLYLDLRDLGVDLRIFDPDSDHVAQRRFLDSNLFTYAANGDELMDVSEATQILAYMISAKAATARVHRRISELCRAPGATPELDFWGFPLIEARCYRKIFFERHAEMWSNMPELSEYYRVLRADPKRKRILEAFERNIEAVSRKQGYSEAPFTSSETDTIFGLLQYLETVFMRFDLDRSGTIGMYEAFEAPDAAFPVFRGALARASGFGGDKNLRTLFSFLLGHGRIPGTIDFIVWRLRGPEWSFEADRGRMIEIMAELSAALKAKERQEGADLALPSWVYRGFSSGQLASEAEQYDENGELRGATP
ncbi:MAG: hypothetical protein NDJ90_09230 [Oligoflexia bacterium]|nr:hypothetical protein [Oligoflexia bacterium]